MVEKLRIGNGQEVKKEQKSWWHGKGRYIVGLGALSLIAYFGIPSKDAGKASAAPATDKAPTAVKVFENGAKSTQIGTNFKVPEMFTTDALNNGEQTIKAPSLLKPGIEPPVDKEGKSGIATKTKENDGTPAAPAVKDGDGAKKPTVWDKTKQAGEKTGNFFERVGRGTFGSVKNVFTSGVNGGEAYNKGELKILKNTIKDYLNKEHKVKLNDKDLDGLVVSVYEGIWGNVKAGGKEMPKLNKELGVSSTVNAKYSNLVKLGSEHGVDVGKLVGNAVAKQKATTNALVGQSK